MVARRDGFVQGDAVLTRLRARRLREAFAPQVCVRARVGGVFACM